MKDFLKTLEFNFLEIVSYILPGFLALLILFSLFSDKGVVPIEDNLVIFLILAYIIGQALHTLARVPERMLWRMYNKLQGSYKNPDVPRRPTTMTEKLCELIRCKCLEPNRSTTLARKANEYLQQKYGLDDKDHFGRHYLKEALFSSDSELPGKYEHLHYQTILNRSLASIFSISTVLVPLKAIFSNLKIRLNAEDTIDFKYIAVVLTIVCLTLAKIFYKRGVFFKQYRDEILNAFVVSQKRSDNDD